LRGVVVSLETIRFLRCSSQSFTRSLGVIHLGGPGITARFSVMLANEPPALLPVRPMRFLSGELWV